MLFDTNDDISLFFFALSSSAKNGIRTGQAPPAMYTETLPGDQSLALIIPALLESMAGTYFCSASYAAQRLEVSVQIETYGKYDISVIRFLYVHFSCNIWF